MADPNSIITHTPDPTFLGNLGHPSPNSIATHTRLFVESQVHTRSNTPIYKNHQHKVKFKIPYFSLKQNITNPNPKAPKPIKIPI